MCRQILRLDPARLVVLDNSEANLYHLTEELNSKNENFKNTSFFPHLGSVLDCTTIDYIINRYQIDTVYHAAAYKHVPIVEAQPDQGVQVNVFGTLNVLDSSIKNGVSDFMLISTDKAVRPTNSMGASKRVAELVLQAKSGLQNRTRISMVRFGNVLGSSGSVVPKFQKQIRNGGPVTITHREVTRFFMTIPEAAQLVLQSSALAKGGDVFVLDMGVPIKILDLAESMVRLSGQQLKSESKHGTGVEIVETGLRAGEKMYEELFIAANHEKTEIKRIFTASEFSMPWDEINNHLQKMQAQIQSKDYVGLRALLLDLAFRSDNVTHKNGNAEQSVVRDKGYNGKRSAVYEKQYVHNEKSTSDI